MIQLHSPTAAPSLRPADLPPATVEALYVHIPFCFHKCHYCDFYSITRQTPERMAGFVDLILAEARFWLSSFPGPPIRPRTIFFGGGTPTLLCESSMQKLLNGLCDQFDLSGVVEWTVEANPATVSEAYCRRLRAAGVNRLSFGAQSFDPAELATLERHHQPQDVLHSIEMARSADFRRLNVDLIYAIPGQTLESWSRSLEAAIALDTEHLSCYGLTYEPNTPITVRKRLGEFSAAEESVELAMLRHTRDRLTQANRPPYEISNYAQPGRECMHNLVYWTGGNYIGLGPSAASHIDGWRWKNRPHLREWEEAITQGHLPAADVEQLSRQQRAGELAMLMLRLSSGLNFAQFQSQTGRDARKLFQDPIDRFTRTGLLTITPAAIHLTDQGLPVADALASEFLTTAINAKT